MLFKKSNTSSKSLESFRLLCFKPNSNRSCINGIIEDFLTSSWGIFSNVGSFLLLWCHVIPRRARLGSEVSCPRTLPRKNPEDLVWLEPRTPGLRVKHRTTEPSGTLLKINFDPKLNSLKNSIALENTKPNAYRKNCCSQKYFDTYSHTFVCLFTVVYKELHETVKWYSTWICLER